MTALANTLVLGGARSGKSAFAENLVRDSGLARIYLATATAGDDEMKARVAQHRAQRGDGWTTIEEPLALVDALTREATHGRAVLVDCLTLWLSNLMLAGRGAQDGGAPPRRGSGRRPISRGFRFQRGRAGPGARDAARPPFSRRAGTPQSDHRGRCAACRVHRRRTSALAQTFVNSGELICPAFPSRCSPVSLAPARPRCCARF